MKTTAIRTLPALAANLTVLLTTAVISVRFFLPGADESANFSAFYYFTTLSNILAAVAAVPMIVFLCRRLRDAGAAIPGWAHTLRYVGTSAVTLTFMTVFLFLAPLYHFHSSMFTGNNFFFHILNPTLAVLSFLLFEAETPIPKKSIPLAVLPTALYGALYFVMVVVIGEEGGGWIDFYGFNIGGLWYVSMPVVILASFVFAALLRLIRSRSVKKLDE